MNGVNQTTLIGYVGADPEYREFPNGSCVCNISLATPDSYTDRNTNQKVEIVDWHRVVFKSTVAQFVRDNVSKGFLIYVQGPSRTRKYFDEKSQTEKSVTEIISREFRIIDRSTNSNYEQPHDYSNTNHGQFNPQHNQNQFIRTPQMGGRNRQNGFNGMTNNHTNNSYNNQNFSNNGQNKGFRTPEHSQGFSSNDYEHDRYNNSKWNNRSR